MAISPRPESFERKVTRNALRQGMIIRADEAHALPGGRASHEVEQRNTRGVEAENGIVHRGFMHGHEHDGVGPLRDRAFDQCDLLPHIVRLLGHVVRGGGAEPCCGPVGADASGLIGRIGAVLGEDGDPRCAAGRRGPVHFLRPAPVTDCTPSRVLVVDVTAELVRRAADPRDRLRLQGLADLVRLERLVGGARELVDDRLRRAGRRDQPEPQDRLRSPVSPASIMVGRSGMNGLRLASVTASATSLPTRTCSITVEEPARNSRGCGRQADR